MAKVVRDSVKKLPNLVRNEHYEQLLVRKVEFSQSLADDVTLKFCQGTAVP